MNKFEEVLPEEIKYLKQALKISDGLTEFNVWHPKGYKIVVNVTAKELEDFITESKNNS